MSGVRYFWDFAAPFVCGAWLRFMWVRYRRRRWFGHSPRSARRVNLRVRADLQHAAYLRGDLMGTYGDKIPPRELLTWADLQLPLRQDLAEHAAWVGVSEAAVEQAMSRMWPGQQW